MTLFAVASLSKQRYSHCFSPPSCINWGMWGNTTVLLLTTIEPHHSITFSTVTHWLMSLLKLFGTDTSIFSTHSVKGASSSRAANAGGTYWSSEPVFKKSICSMCSSYSRAEVRSFVSFLYVRQPTYSMENPQWKICSQFVCLAYEKVRSIPTFKSIGIRLWVHYQG